MKTLKKIIFFSLFISIFFSCSTKSDYNKNLLLDTITVSEIKEGYSIIPNCYEMDEGLIFYPGGLVEPDAYIPMLSMLANKYNIAIFISSMPLNLAILNKNAADNIINKYVYINSWYIAGHSLGGVIAGTYVYDNPNLFKGLILLASYPMNKKPLNDLDIKVLSIIGSNDGLVDMDKISKSKTLLPLNTHFFTIEGGNHAKFGSYGIQKGDNIAGITEKEQHNITTDLITNFLSSNN